MTLVKATFYCDPKVGIWVDALVDWVHFIVSSVALAYVGLILGDDEIVLSLGKANVLHQPFSPPLKSYLSCYSFTRGSKSWSTSWVGGSVTILPTDIASKPAQESHPRLTPTSLKV